MTDLTEIGVFNNSTSGGAVQLQVAQWVPKEQLAAFRDIEGLAYYGSRALLIHFGIRKEADWEEVTSRVLCVLADIYEIEVGSITLLDQKSQDNDLSHIVKAAAAMRA